jgi:hypothetical protein
MADSWSEALDQMRTQVASMPDPLPGDSLVLTLTITGSSAAASPDDDRDARRALTPERVALMKHSFSQLHESCEV